MLALAMAQAEEKRAQYAALFLWKMPRRALEHTLRFFAIYVGTKPARFRKLA